MFKKLLTAFILFATLSPFFALATPTQTISSLLLGDGNIYQKDQWTSTSSPVSAITQSTYGKAIKITGLSDGCLGLTSGVIGSSGSACGSGGGGSQTPWTSAIDGGGYSLTNAGTITATNFVATSTTATSTFAGAVAIGTTTDSSAILDVHGFGNTLPMIQAEDVDSQSASSGGIMQVVMDSGSAILSGTRLGGYQFAGDNGDNIKRLGGAINALATQNWTSSANGTQLRFNVTANGASSRTTAMVIDQSANVGIGTSSPYRQLSVGNNAVFGADVLASYFTATSSTASTFPYASTTAISSENAWFTGSVGVGTTSPSAKLSVHAVSGETNKKLFVVASSTSAFATTTVFEVLNNTLSQVNVGQVGFRADSNGAISIISAVSGNSGSLTAGNGVIAPSINGNNSAAGTLVGSSAKSSASVTSAVGLAGATFSQTSTPTNGFSATSISPIYNQASGSAANTDLLLFRTETAIGSGAQYLIDAKVGGSLNSYATSTKFSIDRTGLTYFSGKVGIGTTTPTQKLTVAGDIGFYGTIPTITGAGGSPAIALGSTDTAGEITEGTVATGATITFVSAKTNAPFCTVTSQAGLLFTYTTSTTAITIVNVGALSSTKLNYHCIQSNK